MCNLLTSISLGYEITCKTRTANVHRIWISPVWPLKFIEVFSQALKRPGNQGLRVPCEVALLTKSTKTTRPSTGAQRPDCYICRANALQQRLTSEIRATYQVISLFPVGDIGIGKEQGTFFEVSYHYCGSKDLPSVYIGGGKVPSKAQVKNLGVEPFPKVTIAAIQLTFLFLDIFYS